MKNWFWGIFDYKMLSYSAESYWLDETDRSAASGASDFARIIDFRLSVLLIFWELSREWLLGIAVFCCELSREEFFGIVVFYWVVSQEEFSGIVVYWVVSQGESSGIVVFYWVVSQFNSWKGSFHMNRKSVQFLHGLYFGVLDLHFLGSGLIFRVSGLIF